MITTERSAFLLFILRFLLCDFCHVSQNEDGGLEGEELLAFLKDLLERQGGSQKVFCLT